MSRGKLITIEGVDGAGKSTLAVGLLKALRARGVSVCGLREPGGVELSERLRALLADPALQIGAEAETLLYAAARAELVRLRVTPLLRTGTTVLLDRFLDSSLAYQGAARGLGVEAVRAVNLLATDGLGPDRTLLLRIDPARARERLRARGMPADRLERAGEGFFARVARAYDALAEVEPDRIRSIDASGAPEEVLALALEQIGDLLLGGGGAQTHPPSRGP